MDGVRRVALGHEALGVAFEGGTDRGSLGEDRRLLQVSPAVVEEKISTGWTAPDLVRPPPRFLLRSLSIRRLLALLPALARVEGQARVVGVVATHGRLDQAVGPVVGVEDLVVVLQPEGGQV